MTTPVLGRLITIVRRKNRPACVMLPGAGGGVTPYLRLASYLGATHNIYAVRPAGLLPDETPEATVAEMADSALKAMEDSGIVPDLVFGWSLGGVVAWEVCAALAERGHRPDLVLVDCSPMARVSTDEEDADIRDTIVGQLGPRPAPDTVQRLERTFQAQVAALAAHRAELHYAGRVLLLLCSPDTEVRSAAEVRWRELADGDLEQGRLRSGHFDVFEPEYLSELSAAIGAFLGRDKEVAR
ncbi:alpha/beta fold hydrolase [Solihabitans fulvus]|uniref:Alpha/beta fold hydrolase n=1 Tax=Solihabitans fulvus TaxID=1892852 RepID=A0A5B2WWX3_9PSEU|nr:alpha/beta fold hydrolase [Solihabitans fulvus]KAA2255370.1 alpha/beta fold hydrolase [Solihabitans fulvus]